MKNPFCHIVVTLCQKFFTQNGKFYITIILSNLLFSDSLLDDLDGNHSSRSSSAGTPPLHQSHDRSTGSIALPDRSSNCSSSASMGGSGGSGGGGPMHGKKARKARTIFTDKQLQELETTFVIYQK